MHACRALGNTALAYDLLVTSSGVVLLGGTAGVGLEAACRFAEAGARGIVLMGRDAGRGAAACEVVRGRVPNADVGFVAVDARDAGGATRAAAAARERLGEVEVLVTSTGPSRPPRLLHTIPIDDVEPTVDEILLPPLLLTTALLPAMRAQGRGGAVVLVASDAAKVATPGETLIGAAMAAMLMFARATALEVKRDGVRINVVTPSLIANTPGAEMIADDPFSAKLFEKVQGMAGLGIPEPSDLADTILFLAGPHSQRITGQALSVNGGISAA